MNQILKAKKLARKYARIREQLRQAGIMKTNDIVQCLGEFYASKKFRLKLEKNGSPFDARKGRKKYEIKTRAPYKGNISLNFHGFKNKKGDKKFDSLICVSLDDDYCYKVMVEIPYRFFKKYYNLKNDDFYLKPNYKELVKERGIKVKVGKKYLEGLSNRSPK